MVMWVFMFILALPIPIIMIFLGKYMLLAGYKQSSDWIGYRTEFARKNMDTWAYAKEERK